MTERIETFDGQGNLVSAVDGRDLTVIKEAKKELVNIERERQLDLGMWCYGHFWDTAERGRANVSGMVAGLAAGVPLPQGFVWRSKNNVNVPFTAQMLVGLGAYTLQFVNQVYGASWYIKSQIDTLTTLEAVDNFNIRSHPGWPTGNMDGTMPPPA